MVRLWLTRSATLDLCRLDERATMSEYVTDHVSFRWVEVDPADLRLMRRFHADEFGRLKWSEVKHLVHDVVDVFESCRVDHSEFFKADLNEIESKAEEIKVLIDGM